MTWSRNPSQIITPFLGIKVGPVWVFLERTRWRLNKFQFTRHFIEFILVETEETNQVVFSISNDEEGCGKQRQSGRILFFHMYLIYLYNVKESMI